MKTVSENANRNVASDKTSNKKGPRKFLQTLQPAGGDKENLVGTGRFNEKSTGTKVMKTQDTSEIEVKTKENKSAFAKVNPSLYKKLIIEDLTSTAGPSEKYWEVIAERRRKALEDVIEQNRHLHSVIMALEEENVSCKKLLEETTNLVNTLKEILEDDSVEDDSVEDDNNDKSLPIDCKKLNSNRDGSNSESE